MCAFDFHAQRAGLLLVGGFILFLGVWMKRLAMCEIYMHAISWQMHAGCHSRCVRQLLGKEALAKFELCTQPSCRISGIMRLPLYVRSTKKLALTDSTERLSRLHIRGGTPPVCLVMQGEKLVWMCLMWFRTQST